jgi:hypothetical protein
MTEFDDQLSRSLADRSASAADDGSPDLYDVRRRVGHQRTMRRVVSGACALVLVAGAGVAFAVHSNGSQAPAAADGTNGGEAPASTPAPASTVPDGACGAGQIRTAATDTFIHHGMPYTLAAGQCISGQAGKGPVGEMVSVSGCNVTGYAGAVPTTTPAGALNPTAAGQPPTCLPADCTISAVPPAPPIADPGASGATVQIESGTAVAGGAGGGSEPAGGYFTCSSSTAPAGTLPAPPSTVDDPVCPDGQVGVSDGDVVLRTDELFTPTAGQCVVATAQPVPPMVTCTAAVGQILEGTIPSDAVPVTPASGVVVAGGGSIPADTVTATATVTATGTGGGCGCIVTGSVPAGQTVVVNGSIVAPSGTMPGLTTIPGEPTPQLSVGCAGPGAVEVGTLAPPSPPTPPPSTTVAPKG